MYNQNNIIEKIKVFLILLLYAIQKIELTIGIYKMVNKIVIQISVQPANRPSKSKDFKEY